jgi:U4/U6.U5 tri-snRNP-associated protein 1
VITEDELQNVEMAEEEKTKKNHDLKIKKPDYTGYDDDEFEPGNQGMRRAVLAKYDAEIEGTREIVCLDHIFDVNRLTLSQGFRLGATVSPAKAAQVKKSEEDVVSINKSLLSIDYTSKSY